MGPEDSGAGNVETGDWRAAVEVELDGVYQLAGVLSVLLVQRDGIPLVSIPPGKAEPRRLAAMLAAVRGTAEIATDEMAGGHFQQALLRSDRSEIFCVSVGEDHVLGVVAEKGALTGLLFMAVEGAAGRILTAFETA